MANHIKARLSYALREWNTDRDTHLYGEGFLAGVGCCVALAGGVIWVLAMGGVLHG